MTPPTLQNYSKNTCHVGYSLPIAILTFLAKNLFNIFIILSTRSSLISSCFLRRSYKVFILSMFRYACPRPLNSSSILNNQVFTYRLFDISLASYNMNSYSSQISTALIGVGTSAIQNTFLLPHLVEQRFDLAGSPHRIGTCKSMDSLMSSVEGRPGTIYDYLPLMSVLILLIVLGL